MTAITISLYFCAPRFVDSLTYKQLLGLVVHLLLHRSTVVVLNFSTTAPLGWIHRQTRMRVVDNSDLGKKAMLAGKPPYIIDVYKQGQMMKRARRGLLGDKVLVAIMGELKRGYIVGHKTHPIDAVPMQPRSDTNNVVLVDNDGNPLGTRILVPIPASLRGKKGDISKILAIATKFV